MLSNRTNKIKVELQIILLNPRFQEGGEGIS
jgi:hypothetical protein